MCCFHYILEKITHCKVIGTQTFLPYPNFKASARCLDYKRLGKQRVEALQILRTLRGESDGWKYHPAVRMWRGYEGMLIEYAVEIITEWKRRGYVDNCLPLVLAFRRDRQGGDALVPWLGDPAFHSAMRSNLLRKDPVYYGKFGWTEPADLPYVWPAEKIQ